MDNDPALEQITSADDQPVVKPTPQPINWSIAWETLIRFGLGETVIRVATGLASILVVLIVVWVMSSFYLPGEINRGEEPVFAAPQATPTATVVPPAYAPPGPQGAFYNGIARMALMHTNLPAKPRAEVEIYEVQPGDTIIGIAEKFNLKPETIFWGNYYVLIDDPHRLKPSMKLNILPADGVYYDWHAGDGLNGVANFFGVETDAIINWAGNRLNKDTLGDFTNPDIKPGTWLFIPNGKREMVSFSAPRIPRSNPAVAKVLGAGSCGQVTDGPVGNGTFIWPTNDRTLSGYDYSPETNHYGIDINGNIGDGVYAVDAGVVVYSGWNDWGYGNVIVIDHGNGWQSLYAHLNAINSNCGAYVSQGDAIGALGTTGNSSGPHLHFELRSDTYGKVNPWNFLK